MQAIIVRKPLLTAKLACVLNKFKQNYARADGSIVDGRLQCISTTIQTMRHEHNFASQVRGQV